METRVGSRRLEQIGPRCTYQAKEFTLSTHLLSAHKPFLVASLFAVRVAQETKGMLLSDSTLDFYLSPTTKMCLSSVAAVSAELWSTLLRPSKAMFSGELRRGWLFSSLVPFGKDGSGGSEELLSRHGGSVCVLLPFDNMVATI
jgi:hypothetical protein